MSLQRGLDILAQRIEQVPECLRQTLAPSLPTPVFAGAAREVITTGIGSSEAAAKYLQAQLNRIPQQHAEFLPTCAFYGELPAASARKHLVVFTQGLSPNAQIVLARRSQFAGLTLVTSSTLEGQRQAGKTDRAQLLQDLEAEGASIVTHPMEDEFEILPRIIGPVCALLAAWKVAASVAEAQSTAAQARISDMLDAVWAVDLPDTELLERCAHELLTGVDFYFSDCSSLYAQNLAAKVLETVFCAPPRIRDLLDYSHGPFQAERAQPGHRWIFTSEQPAALDLVARLRPLLERVNPPVIIQSPVPEPYAIFYYERFLNVVVLRAAKLAGYNLIDWPGKLEDGEGYALQQPYAREL